MGSQCYFVWLHRATPFGSCPRNRPIHKSMPHRGFMDCPASALSSGTLPKLHKMEVPRTFGVCLGLLWFLDKQGSHAALVPGRLDHGFSVDVGVVVHRGSLQNHYCWVSFCCGHVSTKLLHFYFTDFWIPLKWEFACT